MFLKLCNQGWLSYPKGKDYSQILSAMEKTTYNNMINGSARILRNIIRPSEIMISRNLGQLALKLKSLNFRDRSLMSETINIDSNIEMPIKTNGLDKRPLVPRNENPSVKGICKSS